MKKSKINLNCILNNGSFLIGSIEPFNNYYKIFFEYVIKNEFKNNKRGNFNGSIDTNGNLFFDGQGHINFIECGQNILDYFNISIKSVLNIK